MSCINPNITNFKKLTAIYGADLAESFVRGYSTNVKNMKEDFFYPTAVQVKDWLTADKKKIPAIITKALKINPNLSADAIKGLLKGVVNKYQGSLFITSGWVNNGSLVMKQEVLETVHKPNLAVMQELQRSFPNIFRIIDTRTNYVKVVEIKNEGGPVASETEGRTADNKIRSKYFSDGTIQNVATVLEKIANSIHPLNKLATQLLTYANTNNVKIELEPKPYFANVNSEIKQAGGYYNPETNTIHIAEFASVKNGLSEKLLLHEILHALSSRAIKGENNTFTKDFKRLFDHAVEKLGKYNVETKEGWYGTHDIDEFFVGLFTDSKFVKKLQSVDALDNVNHKNLFEELMDYILKLIGVDKKSSLYSQAFATATNILDLEKSRIESVEDELEQEFANQINSEEAIMLQKQGATISSKASPKTIAMVKDFLKRIGVDVQSLQNIVINGVKQDANGVALIMQKLVQVVDGMESQSLPEEAMHFAVEILEQTNPALFNQLLKEINGYRILDQVIAEYGTDPNYQTKEGKPDIRKLKKEAIAKVLAEKIINNSEGLTEKPELLAKVQTWWSKILDYLKGLFTKSGFDLAAMKIMSGEDIGTAEDIRAQQGDVYLQQTQQSKQDQVFDKLKQISSTIEKKDDGYYINGKKVARRVSDIVKDWYDRRFADKSLTNDEFADAVNTLKADKGTAGHADLEYIQELFVDKDGYLREEPLDDSGYVSQLNPDNRDMYELLKKNLKQRLESFPKGTRFLAEMMMYDAKRDLAGTVDFLAIEPDGKVNILDWKFMDLNIEKYTDVPWYKVNAWNTQMEQYKLMLKNVYGVKEQDFGQTRMIPIKAIYSKGNKKENILPQLMEIQIGDVNVENITEDYLIPVGLESEKTGEKKIDSLLVKLNAIYKKISETKVLPSEKLGKAEQLNALFSAIRQLQMKKNVKPLIYQARVLNKQINDIINTYNTKFKGKDPKSFSEDEITDFTEVIEKGRDALHTYTKLDTELKFLFQGKQLTDEDKETYEGLKDAANDARDVEATLKEVDEEFTNDIIGGSEDVKGLSKGEKIVRGMAKWFGNTATIQLKALEVLFKKANRAFTFAGMDTLTETKRLQQIKDNYQKWATSKGYSIRNEFDIIKKKDKNELIDEFDPEFYSKLKTAIADRDYDWIRANVDKDQLKTLNEEKLQEEYKRIEDKVRLGTDEEIENLIQWEKDKATALYNIDLDEGFGWLQYDLVKKFPDRSNWESKEWKTLTQKDSSGNYINQPALDFYNYIKERNEYYQSIGYINAKQARTFLPWVRKGLSEKLIFGGKISMGEQFLRSISLDEGDVGFGKINPLTGKLIDTIPIYFTKEIEGEVSTDLFKTMAVYNEMAIKFKYLSDIEAQGRALIRLEKNKGAIKTSYFGKTEYKDGVLQTTPDNDENAKIIEDMVKSIIYQQKFIQSDNFDQILGTLGTFGEKLNKKLGFKLLPEDLSGRQVSINKVISQMNNTFQLNALGLNVLSSMSNLFGGHAQSHINAGKYFTKADFVSTEMWLLGNKMGGKDAKKAIAAIHYFLPFMQNYNAELAKSLSLSKLTQENVQDFLMVLMRSSDKAIQSANFFSYLNNSVIENGEIVNAREFLRTTPEYIDMYEGTAEQRKARESKFEEDVKALIEEKGVMKLSEVVNNELVIPGISQKSESVLSLRTKVQQINSDALGGLSEANKRLINMNIYGNSFMIFKNWIPRLVDVRTGNLKYNSASDAYEWGRMRMIYRVISEDVMGSLGNLKDSLLANDKGIAFLRELYQKKKDDYEKDTDKELEMTESQFIDLVRGNIKNQMLDVVYFATLIAIVAGLKANAPDDDEDPLVKNQYKFLLKATDKFRDEITYFYDPSSLTKLVSGGVFPAIGLIDNYKKILTNFLIENYALAVGDEKLAKKTYVIKYLMKSFPVTNTATGMLPMFYPALAKDLGIKMQSQSGIR